MKKYFLVLSLMISLSFFWFSNAEENISDPIENWDTLVCTMEYAPVCWQPDQAIPICPAGTDCMVVDQLKPKTYSNKCVMNSEWAEFLYEGKCKNEIEKCVWLWWYWPNGSLWPNDSNANKKCCPWLTLVPNPKAFKISWGNVIWVSVGWWTICAKINDGICDKRYENIWNSPKDCGKINLEQTDPVEIIEEINPSLFSKNYPILAKYCNEISNWNKSYIICKWKYWTLKSRVNSKLIKIRKIIYKKFKDDNKRIEYIKKLVKKLDYMKNTVENEMKNFLIELIQYEMSSRIKTLTNYDDIDNILEDILDDDIYYNEDNEESISIEENEDDEDDEESISIEEDEDGDTFSEEDDYTYSNDKTKRISYWYGKVNQHNMNWKWYTDKDWVSWADIDKLKYCKKFWPNTESVKEYKKETINTWKNRWNKDIFKSTRISYECVQWDDLEELKDKYYREIKEELVELEEEWYITESEMKNYLEDYHDEIFEDLEDPEEIYEEAMKKIDSITW